MPILFATGYADAKALMGVGEHQIVQKPFMQAELARKLSRIFMTEKATPAAQAPATGVLSNRL